MVSGGDAGSYTLITLDDHRAFEWFKPGVSHIHTDTRRWVPRVVQWADNVARGREDRRKSIIRAESIEGGTIGSAPAPKHLWAR